VAQRHFGPQMFVNKSWRTALDETAAHDDDHVRTAGQPPGFFYMKKMAVMKRIVFRYDSGYSQYFLSSQYCGDLRSVRFGKTESLYSITHVVSHPDIILFLTDRRLPISGIP
jgi:hypothetical protein